MVLWLERCALQFLLPAVRTYTPLEAGFQKNIMFLHFQSWDIVSMLVSLGKATASLESSVNEYPRGVEMTHE